MLLNLLFSDTLEQLWKDRFEGTAEWRRPFNEIENWMSLSVDTQEKSYTIWQDQKHFQDIQKSNPHDLHQRSEVPFGISNIADAV